VLGDLRAKAAVPTLLATLKKPIAGDNHRGALYALGMIADPGTAKEIVAVLNDAKQDYKDRISAAEALNFLGEPSAFPALLAAAKAADVTKDGEKYPDVRIAAAMAYARLGGPAEAAAFAPVVAAEKAAPEQFKECATRLELAKKCDKNVGCYADALADPSLPKQEKAAFMLGRLGKGAAPVVAKKISIHEPIVRLALLFSAGRVIERGSADAQAAIKAIDTQIDIDRTKPNMREVVNEMRALKAWLQSK
jgi:HEAT repeat protein